MSTVGLITEYNPFHMGHKYHIEQAKKITGAENTLVIMSGNYVQRGTPAFMDKHTRTKIALNHGADIVFELPVPFSCASAEYFAYAAVSLLNKTGIVDYLCFGCETDNLTLLKDIANTLVDAKNDTSHPLNELIKEYVKDGLSYAVARSTSLCDIFAQNTNISEILNKPNNILAIEYLKALALTSSGIEPVLLRRTVSSYHDSLDNDFMYSASSLRNTLNTNASAISSESFETLYSFDEVYKESLYKSYPVLEKDFNIILGEKLLKCKFNNTNLTEYMGIDTHLSNRIINILNDDSFNDWNTFISLVKTKNIAYTSISRALLAILLDITKTDFNSYLSNNISSYIKMLGFKKSSSDILNKIKKHGHITPIGQLSEIKTNPNLTLSEIDMTMLNKSIYCDELYNMILRTKFNSEIKNEYQKKLIIK